MILKFAIILLNFILINSCANAQLFVRKQNIDSIKGLNYFVVVFEDKSSNLISNNEYHVVLEDGYQKYLVFTDEKSQKEVSLNSLTAIINYVSNKNWDLVQITTTTVNRRNTDNYYLINQIIFKRKLKLQNSTKTE